MKSCNKATMKSTGGEVNPRVPHSQLPYPKNLITCGSNWCMIKKCHNSDTIRRVDFAGGYLCRMSPSSAHMNVAAFGSVTL